MKKRRFSAEELDGILRKAKEMDRRFAGGPGQGSTLMIPTRASLINLLRGPAVELKSWGLWFTLITRADRETRQEYQRRWQAAYPGEDFLGFCKRCYEDSGPCQAILDAQFRRLRRASPPA